MLEYFPVVDEVAAFRIAGFKALLVRKLRDSKSCGLGL